MPGMLYQDTDKGDDMSMKRITERAIRNEQRYLGCSREQAIEALGGQSFVEHDGFSAQEIRMTQQVECVGRSEAVRLLRQGRGWKKPEPCKHIYGFCDDTLGRDLMNTKPSGAPEDNDIHFKYCPLCGEKL